MRTTARSGSALFAAISLFALAGCSTSVTRGPVAASPLVAFAVPAPAEARSWEPRPRFDETYFQRSFLLSHTAAQRPKSRR